MNRNCRKFLIEKESILEVSNIFRSLGLSFSLIGTKLLNKAVQIILSLDDEFYSLEDIFNELVKTYPTLTTAQIRAYIKYALDHRNEKLSEKNFKKIFLFEYDKNIFITKSFIDELVNAIRFKNDNF